MSVLGSQVFGQAVMDSCVLLQKLVCSRVGSVAQLSRMIAVIPTLSVEMLQSITNRWRCSKMVRELKVYSLSPIQLLAEPDLA